MSKAKQIKNLVYEKLFITTNINALGIDLINYGLYAKDVEMSSITSKTISFSDSLGTKIESIVSENQNTKYDKDKINAILTILKNPHIERQYIDDCVLKLNQPIKDPLFNIYGSPSLSPIRLNKDCNYIQIKKSEYSLTLAIAPYFSNGPITFTKLGAVTDLCDITYNGKLIWVINERHLIGNRGILYSESQDVETVIIESLQLNIQELNTAFENVKKFHESLQSEMTLYKVLLQV